MKNAFILIALLLCMPISLYSQDRSTGPYITKFGPTFDIPNPDLKLDPNKEHKVIFDVFSDDSKKTAINPLLNTVARHLNMHGKQGVPLENLKTVLVIHGGATASVLSESAFKETFERENPDFELLNELVNAGVEVYVCGQSISARGKSVADVNPNIKVALSAITTLMSYQEKGYSVVNFN